MAKRTAAEERRDKRAARELADAERKAIAELRAASRAVVESLVVRLSRMPSQADRDATLQRAMAEVRRQLAPMREAITRASLSGRDGARTAAHAQFLREWEDIRSAVANAGYAAPGVPDAVPLTDRDRLVADANGASFSAAWGASVLGQAMAWRNAGSQAQLSTVVEKATRLQAYRLDRIAATDTARSFSDEKSDIRVRLTKTYREQRWFPALIREWNAMEEACKVCAGLDQQRRPWGLSFSGGEVPGYVHPGCRCIETTLILTLTREHVTTTVREFEPDDFFVVP